MDAINKQMKLMATKAAWFDVFMDRLRDKLPLNPNDRIVDTARQAIEKIKAEDK